MLPNLLRIDHTTVAQNNSPLSLEKWISSIVCVLFPVLSLCSNNLLKPGRQSDAFPPAPEHPAGPDNKNLTGMDHNNGTILAETEAAGLNNPGFLQASCSSCPVQAGPPGLRNDRPSRNRQGFGSGPGRYGGPASLDQRLILFLYLFKISMLFIINTFTFPAGLDNFLDLPGADFPVNIFIGHQDGARPQHDTTCALNGKNPVQVVSPRRFLAPP